MSRYGSGGRNRTHRTVENYMCLDSFAFRRFIADYEALRGWKDIIWCGNILWNPAAGAAEIRTGKHFRPLKLDYVEGVDGELSRLYFLCPRCDRRVRYLYNYHGYHVCRHCLNANYTSQQRNRGLEAIRRKMRKIVEQDLGYTRWRIENPNRGISDLVIIPKPRYMRWAKYSRLMMEYRELQDEHTRQLLKICGPFLPPGWEKEIGISDIKTPLF